MEKLYKVVTVRGVEVFGSLEGLLGAHRLTGWEPVKDHTRPVLHGAPHLEGLLGPMFDGVEFGKQVIRYEDAATYRALSV